MLPSIGIVVPAYNCAPYLDAALSSLLRQSVPPTQVVVVNDGSTDNTLDVLAKYGTQITVITQPNAGLSNARNRGLAELTTRWVLFLDADDLLEPTALEALCAADDDREHVIYGDKYVVSHEGAIESRVAGRNCTGPVPHAARAAFDGAPFEPGAAMMPVALARRLGGFHQKYSPCEDRHMWIRCGALVEFRYVPHVVLHYRQRPGSLSKNRVRQVTGSLRVRLDALAWLAERGVTLFDAPRDPASLVAADLAAVYWQREWNVVDAVLNLAREYRLSHPDIERVARMRRLPPWVITLKDAFDRRAQ